MLTGCRAGHEEDQGAYADKWADCKDSTSKTFCSVSMSRMKALEKQELKN